MKKVAMLLGVFTLSALPAFAHHGWGGNEDKLTDVTGTVTTAVSLAGPHGTMKKLALRSVSGGCCRSSRAQRKTSRGFLSPSRAACRNRTSW